jgi:hypothetical protein
MGQKIRADPVHARDRGDTPRASLRYRRLQGAWRRRGTTGMAATLGPPLAVLTADTTPASPVASQGDSRGEHRMAGRVLLGSGRCQNVREKRDVGPMADVRGHRRRIGPQDGRTATRNGAVRIRDSEPGASMASTSMTSAGGIRMVLAGPAHAPRGVQVPGRPELRVARVVASARGIQPSERSRARCPRASRSSNTVTVRSPLAAA